MRTAIVEECATQAMSRHVLGKMFRNLGDSDDGVLKIHGVATTPEFRHNPATQTDVVASKRISK